MNRNDCLPSLAAFALTALGCALASAAVADSSTAGPRNTVRMAPPQPKHEAQLASLNPEAVILAHGAADATARDCVHRIGPRNTIRARH